MQNQQSSQILSPCNGNCVIDEKTKLCSGCFRTIEEIMGWITFSLERKNEVVKEVEKRKSSRGVNRSSID